MQFIAWWEPLLKWYVIASLTMIWLSNTRTTAARRVSSETAQLFAVECTNYLGYYTKQTEISKLNVSLVNKATRPVIDTWTRSIFPDIESFQRGSSLQRRGIGEIQNSVLVQENSDHPHVLGIGHSIHLENIFTCAVKVFALAYVATFCLRNQFFFLLTSWIHCFPSSISSIVTLRRSELEMAISMSIEYPSVGGSRRGVINTLSAQRFYTISSSKPLNLMTIC